MKKTRSVLIALIVIFALITLFFGAMSIVSWVHYKKITSNYILTEATIVEITPDEDVYVTFEVDSSLKQVKLSDYSSSWKVGKKLKVYYNPDNYNDATSTEFLIDGPAIMTGLSGFFGVSTLIFVFVGVSKNKKIKWLMENGCKVYAEVFNISTNFNITINYQHPIIIECQHAGNLFKTTSYKLEDANLFNKKIAVYYNPENPKQYFINLDDIVDNVKFN